MLEWVHEWAKKHMNTCMHAAKTPTFIRTQLSKTSYTPDCLWPKDYHQDATPLQRSSQDALSEQQPACLIWGLSAEQQGRHQPLLPGCHCLGMLLQSWLPSHNATHCSIDRSWSMTFARLILLQGGNSSPTLFILCYDVANVFRLAACWLVYKSEHLCYIIAWNQKVGSMKALQSKDEFYLQRWQHKGTNNAGGGSLLLSGSSLLRGWLLYMHRISQQPGYGPQRAKKARSQTVKPATITKA